MSDVSETASPEGIVKRKSPWSVSETLNRLVSALDEKGVTVFATIDHSGEAKRVGLSLRETKLLVFGNPLAGTPLMQAQPLIALDLPLKVLVWQDDRAEVWVTWLADSWLADRYGIEPDRATALSAVAVLVDGVIDRSTERGG
jgi:uncharacterized protein (DUF302 family)